MVSAAEFHFVSVDKPGAHRQPEEERAVRSHVRKAVSRLKKQSIPKLKFVQSKISQKRRIRRDTSFKDCTATVTTVDEADNTVPPLVTGAEEGNDAENSSQSLSPGDHAFNEKGITRSMISDDERVPGLCLSPTFRHPLASFAAGHTNLSIDRCDQLFKSDAYRSAAEPLFGTDHIDCENSIMAVFPNCLENPVFVKALVYSIVQTEQQQNVTYECLKLRGDAFTALNKQLSHKLESVEPSVIGAIMAMKAASAKCGDVSAYSAHTRGLTKALRTCNTAQSCLTEPVRRVLFWLDLFGSVLMGSEGQLSHLMFPAVEWARFQRATSDPSIPVGFNRHRSILPDDLVDCIEDLAEMQTKLTTQGATLTYLDKDNMQASVESRLAFQSRACRGFSPMSEAVRLATFILVYVSWTEIWNSSLIPSKVAQQLLTVLNEISFSNFRDENGNETINSIWNNRWDLLLWLTFVGCSTAQEADKHVQGLRKAYAELLKRLHDAFLSQYYTFCLDVDLYLYHVATLKEALQSALYDFTYCGNWLKDRMRIREWFEVELLLDIGLPALDPAWSENEVYDLALPFRCQEGCDDEVN